MCTRTILGAITFKQILESLSNHIRVLQQRKKLHITNYTEKTPIFLNLKFVKATLNVHYKKKKKVRTSTEPEFFSTVQR